MYVTCNAQITDLTPDERFRLFVCICNKQTTKSASKSICNNLWCFYINQNCLERNARDVVCDFARFLSFTNYTGFVCLEKQGNQNNARVCWLDWRNKMAVVYKLRRLYKSVEKDENFSKFGNRWVSELWKFIESQLHLMSSWICNFVHHRV